MKIVHTAVVTPHQAGLYETVRDLVAAERDLGVDAWIADPKTVVEDRGVPINRGTGIHEADVIVNHSGLGEYERGIEVPVIHCLHGRPESSFRLENNGTVGVYSFLASAAKLPHYKRFVTFWPEYLPYWSLLIPADKLVAIQAPVDLGAWTPDGPSGYAFGGKRGEINVVIADMWREDVTPYHVIHAVREFALRHKGVRLHLYGVPKAKALDVLLAAIERQGFLGEVCGMVTGLANVYRASTMLVSPHRIATRTIREALACGCPAVHATGLPGSTVHGTAFAEPETISPFADAMDLILEDDYRRDARAVAKRFYDSKASAQQMIDLCREVLRP
jgi:glycosyltransferase involved in cell wall biosynthesis